MRAHCCTLSLTINLQKRNLFSHINLSNNGKCCKQFEENRSTMCALSSLNKSNVREEDYQDDRVTMTNHILITRQLFTKSSTGTCHC